MASLQVAARSLSRAAATAGAHVLRSAAGSGAVASSAAAASNALWAPVCVAALQRCGSMAPFGAAFYSDKPAEGKEEGKQEGEAEAQPRGFGSGTPAADAPDAEASAADAEASASGVDADAHAALLKEKEELEAKVKDLNDKVPRLLADMENLRQRSARQTEDAKKFAISKFVKEILDVADNLERATAAVPPEMIAEGAEASDAEALLSQLRGVVEGVQLTEKVLLQVFAGQGVKKFDSVGEKFDPNLHNALFEVPDPTKEVGTVHSVIKNGYTMHDRVVRAADVGVVRE